MAICVPILHTDTESVPRIEAGGKNRQSEVTLTTNRLYPYPIIVLDFDIYREMRRKHHLWDQTNEENETYLRI